MKSLFLQGGIAFRTSTDNVYGCQYSDYIIETLLMEPFKGVEGLTKGRSLDPLPHMIWINTRPHLGEIDPESQVNGWIGTQLNITSFEEDCDRQGKSMGQ